jgi:hypothetical protein
MMVHALLYLFVSHQHALTCDEVVHWNKLNAAWLDFKDELSVARVVT